MTTENKISQESINRLNTMVFKSGSDELTNIYHLKLLKK